VKPYVKDRRLKDSTKFEIIIIYSARGIKFTFFPKLVSLSEVSVKVTINT
jgi:hypothetical protein